MKRFLATIVRYAWVAPSAPYFLVAGVVGLLEILLTVPLPWIGKVRDDCEALADVIQEGRWKAHPPLDRCHVCKGPREPKRFAWWQLRRRLAVWWVLNVRGLDGWLVCSDCLKKYKHSSPHKEELDSAQKVDRG